MDEIETPTTVEQAPPSEPAPPAPTEPSGEPEQVEQAKEVEATPTQETWDAIRQRVEQDEALKPDYDAHIKETHGKAWKQAVDYFEPTIEQIRVQTEKNKSLYETTNAGWETMSGRMKKASEELGFDEEKFMEVLKSYPAAWDALKEIGAEKNQTYYTQGNLWGNWTGLQYLTTGVAQELVEPDLAKKYGERIQESLNAIQAGAQGKDTPAAVGKDFTKDLKAAIEAPHLRKVQKLEAENERLRAGVRSGEGPDTTPKGGGGGGSDRERQLNPDTPVEELVEIQARQEAGR